MLTVGDQLTEPLITHLKMTKEEADKRAVELLNMVGIPEAECINTISSWVLQE